MTQHLYQRGIFWRIVEFFFFFRRVRKINLAVRARQAVCGMRGVGVERAKFLFHGEHNFVAGRWEPKIVFLF